MKKLIVFLFSLILSVVFSTSASAYDVKIDGIYYNLISKGKTAEVTSGEVKYSGEVVIPSSITVEGQEYPVAIIGNRAFYGCSKLTSVTIGNSVTSIGDYAFSRCSGLISVDIPNSVTSIGEYAFERCSGLTSVTIPNSVTSINRNAFEACSGLTSVTIPNSVTSIGQSAFEGCSGLTSVTIPNSVTSIGDWAFSGCSGLTSITIPNSVTSIGQFAFEKCSGLTSITIPNSVTRIYRNAFEACSGLTSVTIPNSVTSIGIEAFRGCSGLTSVTIPNSVTSIGDDAFSGCSGLTSVTIPNSVTSIGNEAFYYCSGLTSVTIPNSVTEIAISAFEECSSLTSVTIPNSVISISGYAFRGCSGLTSVTIPNSVTYIFTEAFAKCSNLENVYCYAEKFSDINSNIFKDSYIEYATLHVPSSAISYYQTTEPWSGFGTIKTLEGTGTGGETKKCETPTISFADGKLTFSCETEEVEYESEVTCSDVNKYYSNEINLAACYDVSVTATKSGFSNSEIATAKLYWLPTSDIGTNINTAKTRGVVIQSAGGFITLSGLDTNERVDFFTVDGVALGSATATDGTATFSAKSGTIVVAKIGKESVKIAVE